MQFLLSLVILSGFFFEFAQSAINVVSRQSFL